MDEAIKKMEDASVVFYRLAQQTNIHQFLEVTGFLNEMIKMYRDVKNRGGDIFTDPLDPKPYEMAYIAEKFDCIFGEVLTKPAARNAFLEALEQKGGWRWQR